MNPCLLYTSRIEAYNQVTQLYKNTKATKAEKSYSAVAGRDEVSISQAGYDYQVAKQAVAEASDTVSYTHLDVYKRQVTYTVTVTFDNSGGELTANTSVYVTFTYGELSDVDYIQTDALDNINDDFATVKTYDENQAVVETKVTIAESTDRYTVITDGITCLLYTSRCV